MGDIIKIRGISSLSEGQTFQIRGLKDKTPGEVALFTVLEDTPPGNDCARETLAEKAIYSYPEGVLTVHFAPYHSEEAQCARARVLGTAWAEKIWTMNGVWYDAPTPEEEEY